jgi:hypothetical protein
MSYCQNKLSSFPFLTGCTNYHFAIPILNYESGDYENYNIDISDLICSINFSSDTYVNLVTLSGDTLIIGLNNGIKFYTDFSQFNYSDEILNLNDKIDYHTGDTNNPHQTTFDNLISTAHTHNISDISDYFDIYTSAGTYSGGFIYFSGHGINYTVDVSDLIDDTNTYVTGGTMSGDTLVLSRNDGVNIYVDESQFNYSDEILNLNDKIDYHTGDTNNPHQTSFYNLTATAHTHNISEVTDYFDIYTSAGTYSGGFIYFSGHGINYSVDVTALLDNTNTYVTGATMSGDTLVLTRNDNVNIYVDESQFNYSDEILYLDGKIDSHTGNTNNPHQTTFSNLVATAHTHSISNITDYFDIYTSAGTYSGGFIYFSGHGINYSVDVSALLDDTNTYVTGATMSGDTLVLSRNDGAKIYVDESQFNYSDEINYIAGKINYHTGDTNNPHQTTFNNLILTAHTHNVSDLNNYFDIYTSAGTYSNGYIYFSGHGINYVVDVTPLIDDTNTYVTGATMSGDTLVLSRNDGINIYVDESQFNYDSEINYLDGKIDSHTGNTNNPHQTSFYNLIATAHTHTTSDLSNYFDIYTSGGTYSGGFIYFSGHGINYSVDVSDLLNTTNTFVTGATMSGDTLVLYRNDNVNIYVDQSQFNYSDEINYLNGKVDYHTGDTNNPHQTTFNNLVSTAHTHSISNITDYFDIYTSGGTYSGGYIWFSGHGINYSVDVTALLDDTNTYVTGATMSGNTLVLSRNDGGKIYVDESQFDYSDEINYLDGKIDYHTGNTNNPHQTSFYNLIATAHTHTTSQISDYFDIYTSGGTYSGGFIYFSGHGINYTVDVSALLDDTNTYVTGATMSGDTLVLSRNDGGQIYVDQSQFNYSDEINYVDGKINSHTGNTNNPHQTTFSNLVSTAHTHTISNITDYFDIYTSAGTYSNGYIYFSGHGINYSVDVSALLDDTNTYVTGATMSGDTLVLSRNDNVNIYVDQSQFNYSDEINYVDGKINSHTGNTNNPHQTSFYNLTATAHTHTSSQLSDYNSMSATTIETLGLYTLGPSGHYNRLESNLYYSSSTSTVYIEPASSKFTIFYRGKEQNKTTINNVTIPNSSATYYIYFDSNGTLQYTTSFDTFFLGIPTTILINRPEINDYILLEERHDITMDDATHLELHERVGAYKVSGFQLSGYTLPVGSPTSNNDNTYSVNSGVIADEDIRFITSSLTDNGPYYVVYKSGTTGNIVWQQSQVPYFTGATFITYNQNSGGNWVQTQLASKQYVNYYVFAIPSMSTNKQIIQIQGQSVFANANNAANDTVSSLDLSGLPFPETALLYKVTYLANNAYTLASGRCKITSVTTYAGGNITVNSSSAVFHNALTGLQGGAAGQYYHLNASDYTDIVDGNYVKQDQFAYHTGDTNNPHQTSFYNLTATAHTHTTSQISDYFDIYTSAGTYSNGYIYFSGHGINFSVDVSALLDDTNTYVTGATMSGDTLVLSRNDGGKVYVDQSQFNYSDEISYLNGKIDSHTGNTNNPHQTTFNNLVSTAHTHTTSQISDYFDIYTSAGTYSGGFIYFSGHGINYSVDVTDLLDDTNTYVTGATMSGDTLVLSRNDNVNIYVDQSQFNYSDEINYLDGKIDSHTGNTNNPHQTTFNNLISTAHTHTISDITNYYDYYLTGGTYSGGYLYFSGHGINFIVDVSDLVADTTSASTNTIISLSGQTAFPTTFIPTPASKVYTNGARITSGYNIIANVITFITARFEGEEIIIDKI